MENSGWSDWGWGVAQKVVADFIKWVVPMVGAPVIAWLRSKNSRWATIVLDTVVGWVCLYILFYGLSMEALMSFAWWMYLVAGGSLAFFIFLDWKRNGRVREHPPITFETQGHLHVSPVEISPQNKLHIDRIHALYRLGSDREGAYELAYAVVGSYVMSLTSEMLAAATSGASLDAHRMAFLRFVPGLIQRATLDENRIAASALGNALNHGDNADYGNFRRIQELFADYYREYVGTVNCMQELKPFVSPDLQPHEGQFNKWQSLHDEFIEKIRSLKSETPFRVLAQRIEGVGI